MLTRRHFSLSLLAGGLLAPWRLLAADARVFKLLIVDSQKGNPYDEVRAALLAALAGLGYGEGRNLAVTLQVTGNDVKEGERLLAAARDFDAIVTGGTVATLAAKNVLLGQPQPVVFASPTDPVGIGVIRDFTSPPFANFTGVCYPVPPKARFKFIRQLLPQARTFGLIHADMPQSASYNQWVRELLAHDPEFRGIEVIFRPVPLATGENGDKVMAEAAIPLIRELDARVDAFIKPNDQMGTRRAFAETVFAHAKKPLVGIVRDDVMGGWGATGVVYPSHESIGQQAARMIHRLFTGAKVAEIAPEWPQKYGFALDLPKANAFGIKVSVELLQLAGENIVK